MDGDVAVVGAGIVGLCAASALHERGADVRLYERGEPGKGQSAGESRLFRHGHDDPRMVEMAKRSRRLYDELASRLGTELVSGDGVIALGEAAVERLAVVERVGGIDARRIDGDEARERLPVLAPFEAPAVLDADGGAIRTTAAVDGLTRVLRESLVREEVIALRPLDRGCEVRSVTGSRRFERVVVCAGRGTAPLARALGLAIPIVLSAHVRATFELAGPAGERLACLQDSSGSFPEKGVYAAPTPGGERYALGLSETLEVTDDGALVDPAEFAALGKRAVAYVREALPGLRPEPVGHVHCWVTEVPWSEDGLAVWEQGPVLCAAGHNLFKLAPALGEDLAVAASGGALRGELRPESRLGAPP